MLFPGYRSKYGVGTAHEKDWGLVKSLDLAPPVPNSTLVPSPSQSLANTESYNKTHRPSAVLGQHKSGLVCICRGLGVPCSCKHELKWAQRSQQSLLELCQHPGCIPARGTDCGSAGVPVCCGSLKDGISAHGNPEGPPQWWDTATALVSITWGDSEWHFRKLFNVSLAARVPHTHAHTEWGMFYDQIFSHLFSIEKNSK